jgi:hypothetical protein
MRRCRQYPERFVRDHVDDDGLRRAHADGKAIADAVARIRNEEATALHQLRALPRP